MRSILSIFAAVFCIALAGSHSHGADAPPAKPFLHPLFSDHMVLQRDTTASVWGWSQPGQKVDVTLAGKSASAIADAQGKWIAKLAPLPAGGPHTMTVAGPQTVEVKDILIGDIWLCSGQSNMQMSVGGSKDANQEIAAATHPRIRVFRVPWCGFGPGQPNVVRTEPQDTVAAHWEVCAPQTAARFTAVGYFFARDLQKEVDVPIGLIQAAVGGSSITAWCAQPMLQDVPQLNAPLQSLETLKGLIKENKVGEAHFADVLKQWWRDNDPGTRDNWCNPDCDTRDWKKLALPGPGKRADIPRFHGIVWFRKEIDISPDWAGKDASLFLTGVYEPDTIWFNGTLVGAFDRGWVNRTAKIPGNLVKPGRNVIATRVLTQPNTSYQGPSDASKLDLIGPKPPPSISLGGERLIQLSTPADKLPPFPHRLDNDFQLPTVLYNGMIAPLTPLSIKGALWYQGETPCPGGHSVHRQLLAAMISDWRKRFDSPEAWFLIVQLPVLGGKPTENPEGVGAAAIRAVQWDVGHAIPNADTAVITDLGDPNDIHPKNKQDVGKRLALIAQARIFGQSVEYSGPVLKSATREGNAVRVRYDHLGGGLVVKGDKLEGFALAGPDNKWRWADAQIDGDDVLVSSPQIKLPAAIRYDYVDVPKYRLWNKANLPAPPFETKVKP